MAAVQIETCARTGCSSARRPRHSWLPASPRLRVFSGGAAPTVLQGRPRGRQTIPLLSPREGIRAESARRKARNASIRRAGFGLMPPPCPLCSVGSFRLPSTTTRKQSDLQELNEVEPAGIEPATSCLQSRSVCPLVSRGVSKIPAHLCFLLDTGGHDKTARDNLMHPWCTLGVACVWAAGSRGSRRRCARLRQLVEVAAPSRVTLASAIAVCASSRGMSSNSSITCP